MLTDVLTALTSKERKTIEEYELQSPYPTVLVVGKAGAGKDTIGDLLRERFGYGTDSMAGSLKNIAEVAFGMKTKDRTLLQGLSALRTLLPSVYLDSVWRRIIFRRTLQGKERFVLSFSEPDDVLVWIKNELFPVTDEVDENRVDFMLDQVYRDWKKIENGKWRDTFTSAQLVVESEPLKHVVLTDVRFPNELQLGLELGATIIQVHASEDRRIERLRRRDGHVDPARLRHSSETALDELLSSGELDNRLLTIDNNGSMEELKEAVYNLRF